MVDKVRFQEMEFIVWIFLYEVYAVAVSRYTSLMNNSEARNC